MEIITVTKENIEQEHICCAITDKKGENCVSSKKAWLRARFDEGLVFKKVNVRGKVFIEYIPAEKAWAPIIADNYMFINCLWVAGKYKGEGFANALLQACIDDAKEKGKNGLVIVSSTKKLPYLSDPNFLKYKGFKIADITGDGYELLYLAFEKVAHLPKFRENAKQWKTTSQGIEIRYTNQCPFTAKYVPLLKEVAKQRGIEVQVIQYQNTEEAQNAPCPFTTFSFFDQGKFVTNEIFSIKKFEKYLDANYA